MDPLELVKSQMSEDTIKLTNFLIRSGATWDWDEYSNKAALEYQEDPQGNRQYYVIVDFDEDNVSLTIPFIELARIFRV